MRPTHALRALTVVAALALSTPAFAQRQELGPEAIPSRYEIAIAPDIEAATFTGTVRIDVTTAGPLSAITLNALDLTIDQARIDGRNATAALNAEAQTLTLTPRAELPAGRHVIDIAYRGKIQDEGFGLFRTSYAGPDGRQQRMLATQFEVADARRFAPMWDQPNRRAVFSLTATVPANLTPISNMPIAQSQNVSGGKKRVRFADSPSMSSYLLYFGLGDIDRITMDVDGVELGVITRKGEGERGRYALQAGAESLRYFTQYFGIPYPLPKLDMIAVPGAANFGAMENWGAILYFENRLLIDSQNSNEFNRQDVWSTVAHEVAHQWFGDLVTMEWWDDLWLNEGFAEWVQGKAQHATHPNWSTWLQAAQAANGAKQIDAREGTHSIVQTVNTLDEANLAFDAITYQKGQAVIRMLESYVGEEAFRTGVRAYLNARLYGNSRTEDLWRAVQSASGPGLLDVARSFTTQEGVPVVRVETAPCRRRDTVTRITLTQSRFAEDDASRTNERWTIPIVARTLGGEERRTLMAPGGPTTIELPGGCGAPPLVNAGQTAYMRTLYADADRARLVARFHELQPADQLGLLQDYWAFGRAGAAPLSAYFEMARGASSANADPYVAMQIAAALEELWRMQSGRPEQTQTATFARAIVRPMFDAIGWDAKPGEAPNASLARDELIRSLGRLGDADIAAEARRRVDSDNPALLHGDIRQAAIVAYAAQATPAQYDTLIARARAERDFVVRRQLFFALAEVQNPALADRTLEAARSDPAVGQLKAQLLMRIARTHPRRTWDYFTAHRAEIEAPLDRSAQLDLAGTIASFGADPSIARAVEAYAQTLPVGSRQEATKAAAEIRARARIVEELAPASASWLAAHASSP